jgi:putative tryptophan/tyrosine transport system substrate-binding protein
LPICRSIIEKCGQPSAFLTVLSFLAFSRANGGASGSGGPPGKRSGQYRHGERTKAATSTIPIIFLTGADPVQFGLVKSLSRPDSNLTGVAILTNTLAPKQLQLLHEVVPSATLVGFLVNPKNPIAESDKRDLQSAASATRQQILVLNASTDGEVENAFAALVQQGAGALLVQSDPFFNSRPDHIVALAARHAIPAIYQWRDFPVAGGLMSYGTVLADAYRQVGIYAGQILKGANTKSH